MTREEKLYSMTMACLIEVADKLGIKVHKKGKKSDAIAKILAKEAEIAEENRRADEAEYIAEVMAEKAELGIECPPIESVEIVDEEAKIKEAKAIVKKMPAKKVAKIVDKAIKKEKAKREAKAFEIPESIINTIKNCNLDYEIKDGSKDVRIKFNNALVGVVYIGARGITLYFSGEVVKSILENAGFTIKESKERFDYYSRIDDSILENALAEIGK